MEKSEFKVLVGQVRAGKLCKDLVKKSESIKDDRQIIKLCAAMNDIRSKSLTEEDVRILLRLACNKKVADEIRFKALNILVTLDNLPKDACDDLLVIIQDEASDLLLKKRACEVFLKIKASLEQSVDRLDDYKCTLVELEHLWCQLMEAGSRNLARRELKRIADSSDETIKKLVIEKLYLAALEFQEKKQFSMACKLYNDAIDRGHNDSKHNLACILIEQASRIIDTEERMRTYRDAYDLLLDAAIKLDCRAQYSLGHFLEIYGGILPIKNKNIIYDLILYCYIKSATNRNKRGSTEATVRLQRLYSLEKQNQELKNRYNKYKKHGGVIGVTWKDFELKPIDIIVKKSVEEELSRAIIKGDIASIQSLAKSEDLGKIINDANVSGFTPLHVAVIEGGINIVQELLQISKIDLNVVDQVRGFTALSYALYCGHEEISALLKKKMLELGDNPGEDNEDLKELVTKKLTTRNSINIVSILIRYINFINYFFDEHIDGLKVEGLLRVPAEENELKDLARKVSQAINDNATNKVILGLFTDGTPIEKVARNIMGVFHKLFDKILLSEGTCKAIENAVRCLLKNSYGLYFTDDFSSYPLQNLAMRSVVVKCYCEGGVWKVGKELRFAENNQWKQVAFSRENQPESILADKDVGPFTTPAGGNFGRYIHYMHNYSAVRKIIQDTARKFGITDWCVDTEYNIFLGEVERFLIYEIKHVRRNVEVFKFLHKFFVLLNRIENHADSNKMYANSVLDMLSPVIDKIIRMDLGDPTQLKYYPFMQKMIFNAFKELFSDGLPKLQNEAVVSKQKRSILTAFI